MLPYIRRIRRPLNEPEVASIFATSIPDVPEQKSENPAPSSSMPRTPAAESSSSEGQPADGQLSASPDRCFDTQMPQEAPRPLTTTPEKRSDFGQFRSDSDPLPSDQSSPAAHLWSRRPDEPAPDYLLFTRWLQIPFPRSFPKAAVTLDCSLPRLRRLSSCFNWKTRAAAFDNHSANACTDALDRLLADKKEDWLKRAERFRLQEWLLYEEMIESAHAAIRELQRHPRRITTTELTRLLDLASILGRRAAGMSLETASQHTKPFPSAYPDYLAALHKIYGDPGENDVPATPASPTI